MPKDIALDHPGSGRLAHANADHPPVAPAKVGVIIANLGTPDATDYWSMRRYLNEFLSDRRVIDYAPWKWQPLLRCGGIMWRWISACVTAIPPPSR